MKGTRIKNFLMLHLVLLIYSGVAVLSKFASDQTGFRFLAVYGAVLACLGLYAVLWQFVLKKYPLTFAFANKAVVVVWGIIWGRLFFHEQISLQKLIGAAVIIFGIAIVVNDDED